MKCPYRRNILHKPEGDFEEFGECYEKECPFYLKNEWKDHDTEEVTVTEHCVKPYKENGERGRQ